MGDRPTVTEAINQAHLGSVVFAARAFATLSENRATVASSRITIGESLSLLLSLRDSVDDAGGHPFANPVSGGRNSRTRSRQ
jgi:hypothetical protein